MNDNQLKPASPEEAAALERLYAGRRAFHGELHDHADTGGTSDGSVPLSVWKEELIALGMDFAAILDHRQVRHMYLPEWDDRLFVCGTEPGTCISDSRAAVRELHYNMIVPDVRTLEGILAAFPEWRFEGGPEGHFVYPSFTTARFGEVIDAVLAAGGFFVIPHPKQIMVSDDPLDYWFRDGIGIEAIYVSLDSWDTRADTALWLDLLRLGKRVYACAGNDEHSHAHDKALTTIYAEAQSGASYLPHLRAGDFTAGPVGIRMCLGETRMGGSCAFAGGRLILSVGDFHRSVADPTHTYRVDLIDDRGVTASAPVAPGQTMTLTCGVSPSSAFLRAEVWDETGSLCISLGNPIWNDGTER